MTANAAKERITRELTACGMTGWGLRKFNSRYLMEIIHDDEHIKGVVYGRYRENGGLLNWVDHMLVATDHRVISLNHKPGFTDMDEFGYDVVTGVETSTAGPFTAITLHTRLRDYNLRFINAACAHTFVEYIESRRLDQPNDTSDSETDMPSIYSIS